MEKLCVGNIQEYTMCVCKDIFYHGSDTFLKEILQPVLGYIDEKKKENIWDDYNEYEHNQKWFSRKPRVVDAHTMESNGKVVGIALGVLGEAFKDFCQKYKIGNIQGKALQLACVYIEKEHRGRGEQWLKDIFRYYSMMDFSNAYIVAAHSKAFPLYHRLCVEVGEFSVSSDHNLYLRLGKIFIRDLRKIE